MDLEEFELVLLRRPAEPTSYDEEALDRPAASLRGLTVFRTGWVEESRRLAENDPAVRAGRLEVEIMRWWCPPGLMVAPGQEIRT